MVRNFTVVGLQLQGYGDLDMEKIIKEVIANEEKKKKEKNSSNADDCLEGSSVGSIDDSDLEEVLKSLA